MFEVRDSRSGEDHLRAHTSSGVDSLLLGLLYLCEFSLLLVLLTSYVVSLKPTFMSFLFSRPGYLFVVGVLGVLFAGAMIVRRFNRTCRAQLTRDRLTVAMNVVTVLVLFVTGEGTVRALSVETVMGDTLGHAYLFPREWDKAVKHHREAIRNQSGKLPYTVYDETLGWTIAPNRSGQDGLYFSSIEGLRSPRMGVAFGDRHPASRIALIGDSYTFGDEVAYEDTWGYQLEKLLGPDVQVLNFGVNAYGTGQAYLRYLQDVRAWHPDVVIFGFVDHDLERTMAVYSSLTFPKATIPFASPRFVLTDGRLTLLNTPLPMPEQIFASVSIKEVPYIEWDRSYEEAEWDRPTWYVPTRSYLFRWLESWYPLPREMRPEVSNAAMREINKAIFEAFVKQVQDDGAVPILVHFPSWRQDSDVLDYTPLGIKILQDADLEYIDPSDCLSPIPFIDRVMPRRHYSPKGNAAVARCLHEPVAQLLVGRRN